MIPCVADRGGGRDRNGAIVLQRGTAHQCSSTRNCCCCSVAVTIRRSRNERVRTTRLAKRTRSESALDSDHLNSG